MWNHYFRNSVFQSKFCRINFKSSSISRRKIDFELFRLRKERKEKERNPRIQSGENISEAHSLSRVILLIAAVDALIVTAVFVIKIVLAAAGATVLPDGWWDDGSCDGITAGSVAVVGTPQCGGKAGIAGLPRKLCASYIYCRFIISRSRLSIEYMMKVSGSPITHRFDGDSTGVNYNSFLNLALLSEYEDRSLINEKYD